VIELQGERDDDRDRTLRVIASIKRDGWRRLLPLTQVFVCAPDSSSVGSWGPWRSRPGADAT
jgi:hypothetical protein